MATLEGTIKLVSGALKKFTRPELGAEILIYTKSVRHDRNNDWWYVPVYPSRDIDRVYDYYDILAKVEEELQAHRQKIALIPVRPRG